MPKKEATLFCNLILKMPSLQSAVCYWSHRQTLVSLGEEYTKVRTARGGGQGGHLGAGYHTLSFTNSLFQGARTSDPSVPPMCHAHPSHSALYTLHSSIPWLTAGHSSLNHSFPRDVFALSIVVKFTLRA